MDNSARLASESSQPKQASVMLLPYSRAAGSFFPGVNFCAPACRWLSIITPNTLREPLSICWAISCATSFCFSCCLLLLAWLQSTIRVAGRCAASRSLHAAATWAAS
ncbi:hypothetical protein D3C71_2006020 [compost metagenome]